MAERVAFRILRSPTAIACVLAVAGIVGMLFASRFFLVPPDPLRDDLHSKSPERARYASPTGPIESNHHTAQTETLTPSIQGQIHWAGNPDKCVLVEGATPKAGNSVIISPCPDKP